VSGPLFTLATSNFRPSIKGTQLDERRHQSRIGVYSGR